MGSWGVAVGSTGVAGVAFLAWRFLSSVRRKTRMVVRRDLFAMQSACVRGECSQIGHDEGDVGNLAWPNDGC